MQPSSVHSFKKRLSQYQSRKEDSFLAACLPLLIKNGRNVRVDPRKDGIEAGEQHDPEEIEENTTPGYRYLLREWEEDGIVTAVGEEFRRGFLPSPFPNDLVKEMRKVDGMTNAKPDRCYGLIPHMFPAPSVQIYRDPAIIDMIALLDSLYHAFFFIEGKSNGGIMAAAENQARRGGATLVFSMREWLSEIKVPDVGPGADNRTFVFSATMTPELILIWVHWAEILPDGTVNYHMDYLESCAFRDDERIPKIRQTIHNIFSWGSTDRVTKLKPYHDQMYVYFRAQQKERVRKRAEAAANKSPNKNGRWFAKW